MNSKAPGPAEGADRTPHGGDPSRLRWAALAILVLAVLLVGIDVTVLGLAAPFLSEDLRPSSTQLLWIGDVYSFVIAGLLVSMGSLGDRVGRKKLLLTGSVAFGALSVLTAYAHSSEAMILWRALMGVAGATLMPSTLALIRNIFPDPRERSLAVGIWGAMTAAGTAVGPVVGGFLLEHYWWGSVFLINLPVMAVLVLVGVKLLPESKNPAPGPWDLPSVGLSMVGIIALVYAVKEAAAYGFRWDVAVTGAAGLVALWAFVRRQLRLPAPLLDMRLFTNRGFTGAVLADLLTILGMSGLVFFLSQFLQMVQDRTPLQAGLAELPAAVGSVVAGLLAGWFARRTSVRGAVSGGLTAVGLALGACLWLQATSSYLLLGGVLLVVGVGAGLAFTVTADVLLSSVPKEQAGAASAVSETAYELGAALGIALLGSVVTGVYRSFDTPSRVPEGAAEHARQSLGEAVRTAHGLPDGAGHALLDVARDTFTEGLRYGAGVGAAVLLAAAALAWRLLRDQRLGEAPAEEDAPRAVTPPGRRPGGGGRPHR
ncbi:MFS transporter [Streptomyces albus subsp. chlorinus]|uniref:MFS transporter n=1 Tax=Streptomyces albus TaxID=1888 RepID=UPI00156D8CA3|nr:MFS transporter [Streptomyces albus]NSC20650.1 MFS transporter [Streptomyces albus subsp. chlorinus]